MMLTQTDIIVLAIKALDRETEDWWKKCDVSDKGREMFKDIVAPLVEKRETLCKLYQIQTGHDYN